MLSKEHTSSIIFTVVNFLGSFLIIVINILKQYVSTKEVLFLNIITSGDIYIICASMAITAIYNFYYFKNEVSNKWPTVIFFISILNYTGSLLFYFLISITTQQVDGLYVWSTIVIFIINIVITYLATYYQNMNTDVVGTRHNQAESLEKIFKESLGGN